MSEHINQQSPKSTKIFGVIKTGANRTDINAIKILQKNGYDEFEIQNETGVHYAVVQSFMKLNDPSFERSEAPITPETQHLHAKIKELEAKVEKDRTVAEDSVSETLAEGAKVLEEIKAPEPKASTKKKSNKG